MTLNTASTAAASQMAAGNSPYPITPRQLFQEATTPISSFQALGGYQGFTNRFTLECTQGSAIAPDLLALNVQFVEDQGNWEVNEWLEQDISRWFEGNSETGQWNRQRNHNYGAGAFFVSENGQVFNAKVANPKADFKKSVGFGKTEWVPTGKQRRYEAVQGGGNRIFYPALDLATRELINIVHNVELPLEGDIWPWLLEHPEISVGITEGAKKALSMCSQGFPCVSVLGIANWSIPRTESEKAEGAARQLMPELVALAAGGRLMPIWYDQDDAKSNLKALMSAKSEGGLLTAALKVAGADRKTSMMWWPTYLGKGIDDVIVGLLKKDDDVVSWILETIAISKNASIYAQIKRLEIIDPHRQVESQTSGGYISEHLDLKLELGKTHALIAGTGSGKTTLINERIQAWTASGGFVVVITPTNKLGKQEAETFGLPHRHDFNNLEHLQLKASNDGGFVCCPDSLPLMLKDIPTDRPLLVVIDEADQVANHCTTGQTLRDKYSATQQVLAELLTRASAVIIAEARIPENTLRIFEEVSGKPTRVFIHRQETNRRKVNCYSGSLAGFVAQIIERLRAGEKLIIPSDSQRELEAIHRLIQKELPHLKGMRVDQQTSHLLEVQELVRNPNELLAREQLDYLMLSPACKSGWSLDGQDNQGNQYSFDRVMAIFRVLPTSEQIQMVARYRPSCPWDIWLAETIVVTGNETGSSAKALSKALENEAESIARGWGIPYDPSDRTPLEKITRNHYAVATVRAGLQKRINRYSLTERLKEDGHEVIELKLENDKAIARQLKLMKNGIDRDWGNRVAAIPISHTDTLEEAKRLEKLETPTPEDRARAKKIRLLSKFAGVNFDIPEICYQATNRYGALTRGVETEAAARHLQAAAMLQKKATIEQYNEPVLAVHHLPHDADRAYLIADCGLMDLVASGQAFTSESPEILELMVKVLAKDSQWSQHFGLNFTADQAPISFFTRLVKKTLKGEIYRSRPGTVDRQYHYQVMTVDLIDRQLATFGVVAESLEKRETVPVDSLDCGTEDDKQVSDLLVIRDRVLVRELLLEAATSRYVGLTSKLYLNGDSINGSVDVGVDDCVEGDGLSVDLAVD